MSCGFMVRDGGLFHDFLPERKLSGDPGASRSAGRLEEGQKKKDPGQA